MNSEKDFGKSVMAVFKKAGFTCIRIESASTISGMPDLYVMGHGDDYFIELKNSKTNCKTPGQFKVEWRPGQQGWAATYKLQHLHCKFVPVEPDSKISVKKVVSKCSWTFQCFNDKIYAIRMEQVFPDDRPLPHSIYACDKVTELIKIVVQNTYKIEEESND